MEERRESTWDECIEANSALNVSPDKAKVNSLVETARGRNQYLKENTIKESNASYIFEGYYSSLLEMLHSLVILGGYKVRNHICLGYYLRDVLKRDDLFRLFDDCRFKRNSLVYYGRRMDFDIAQEAIEKCERLIEELDLLIDENMG